MAHNIIPNNEYSGENSLRRKQLQKVITEDFVYVDKTAFIPKLEAAGSFLFLLRPRRFGKSLFLSMLEHYYDVAYQDEFETLFGHLDIGKSPTTLHNSYPVLTMDFSGIDTDGGYDDVLQLVNDKIDSALLDFLRRYKHPESMQVEVLAMTSPLPKWSDF